MHRNNHGPTLSAAELDVASPLADLLETNAT